MGSYSTIEQLAAAVEASSDILSLPMLEIRDACGYRRLGRLAVEFIANQLRQNGIGFYPNPLPDYQDRWVRLYREGTTMEEVIKAVLVPGVGEDERLREIFSGNAEVTLNRIRALVKVE